MLAVKLLCLCALTAAGWTGSIVLAVEAVEGERRNAAALCAALFIALAVIAFDAWAMGWIR